MFYHITETALHYWGFLYSFLFPFNQLAVVRFALIVDCQRKVLSDGLNTIVGHFKLKLYKLNWVKKT